VGSVQGAVRLQFSRNSVTLAVAHRGFVAPSPLLMLYSPAFMKLKDLNAIITGSSQGLGKVIAKHYLREGANIVLCARSENELNATRAELAANFPSQKVLAKACDVSNETQVNDLVAFGLRELGSLDILVLNAGIYGPRTTGYQDLDEDAWAQVLKTNVMAPLRFAAAMADVLAKGGMKKLAFVSSRMGSIGANDAGGAYIYRSSKAALNAVIKSFALDTRELGLTSISLHPGWVQTDMGGPSAAIDPTTSVTGMRAVIAKAQFSDSGSFFNYDGAALPW